MGLVASVSFSSVACRYPCCWELSPCSSPSSLASLCTLGSFLSTYRNLKFLFWNCFDSQDQMESASWPQSLKVRLGSATLIPLSAKTARGCPGLLWTHLGALGKRIAYDHIHCFQHQEFYWLAGSGSWLSLICQIQYFSQWQGYAAV